MVEYICNMRKQWEEGWYKYQWIPLMVLLQACDLKYCKVSVPHYRVHVSLQLLLLGEGHTMESTENWKHLINSSRALIKVKHLEVGLEGPRPQSYNCLLRYCISEVLSPSGSHHLSEKALESLMFFSETTQDQYSNFYWALLGDGLIALNQWPRSPQKSAPPDPVESKMKKTTSGFNLLLELPFSGLYYHYSDTTTFIVRSPSLKLLFHWEHWSNAVDLSLLSYAM